MAVKRFIYVSGLILLIASPLLACMISPGKQLPRSGFDHKSYVFVGEVIGYTDTITSGQFCGEAQGMRIRPVDVISVPNPAVDYYDLFKFGVTTFCAPKGTKNRYPVGTRLKIVAWEATLLPSRSPENRIRLESKIFDRLSLDNDGDYKTSSESFFDYKNATKSLQENLDNRKDSELPNSMQDFYYIEVSKDLARLENAKTEEERINVLRRLLYCPTVDFLRLIDPSFGAPLPDPLPIFDGKRVKWKREKGIKKLTPTEKQLIKERETLESSGTLKFHRLFYVN